MLPPHSGSPPPPQRCAARRRRSALLMVVHPSSSTHRPHAHHTPWLANQCAWWVPWPRSCMRGHAPRGCQRRREARNSRVNRSPAHVPPPHRLPRRHPLRRGSYHPRETAPTPPQQAPVLVLPSAARNPATRVASPPRPQLPMPLGSTATIDHPTPDALAKHISESLAPASSAKSGG